jgi:signal transduction histidine kinase/CheY-like chemotaxis protein
MTLPLHAHLPQDPLFSGIDAARLEMRVVADLAGQLERSAPWRLIGNGAVACFVLALAWDGAQGLGLLSWLVLMLLHLSLAAWGPWGWWPAVPKAVDADRRLTLAARNELLTGLLWAAAELLILPGADYPHRALLMVILSGLAVGVLQSLSVHLPALYGFFVPVVVGFFVAGASGSGHYFWVAFGLLLIWLTINLNIARLMHRALVESSRHRHLAAALAADMQHQRDRAVDLGQARNRFLAAASHDLRQPVHALSMLVAALQQDLPAAQSRLILAHVESAVAAMGGMFNGLLDISKLDASLVQPQWQVIDLHLMLERLGAGQAAAAASRGLAFECRLPESALWVRTDPALLERVLGNLLSNALRYTTVGGVRLQVRQRAGRVELVVADTGVGIPREQREAIFHEFVRLRAPRTPDESGLGLGLSIVRRLAELLQLQLRLRSRHGRGTVFALVLPAVTPAVVPVAQPDTAAAGGAHGGLCPGDVVLVVDDSAEVRTAMQALLSAWGCEVVAAASVPALMPQLMGLTRKPRLVLCDYVLGADSNGMLAIDELREVFNEDLPAILVTGDTAPARLQEATTAGLPLLHKPVTLPQLRDALSLALAPLAPPAPTSPAA